MRTRETKQTKTLKPTVNCSGFVLELFQAH